LFNGYCFIVCWFPLSFTTCFGLHGHLQVCRILHIFKDSASLLFWISAFFTWSHCVFSICGVGKVVIWGIIIFCLDYFWYCYVFFYLLVFCSFSVMCSLTKTEVWGHVTTDGRSVSQYVLASSPPWDLQPDVISVWILLVFVWRPLWQEVQNP
jgi:hypothetical protein